MRLHQQPSIAFLAALIISICSPARSFFMAAPASYTHVMHVALASIAAYLELAFVDRHAPSSQQSVTDVRLVGLHVYVDCCV